MYQINPENIPIVLKDSYEWATKERVFFGSIESYVELQYAAYVLLSVRYIAAPISIEEWMNQHRKRESYD